MVLEKLKPAVLWEIFEQILTKGIQMVSICPSIENPHSSDERVRIEDIGILYSILKNILGNLGTYTLQGS